MKKLLFPALILSAMAGLLWSVSQTDAVESEYDQPYDKLSSALVTPHIPFANPYYKGKIKALVIAPTWTQRETVELAERLSLDYTPLMTGSFAHFGLSGETPGYLEIPNEQFGAIVYKKLGKDKKYDLIIIGKMSWDLFPRFVQEAILGKIKEGAGLLYIFPPDFKQLDFVFKGDEGRDFILAGIPLKAMPLLKDVPPGKLIRTGKVGQGRVVAVDYDQRGSSSYESITPFRSDDPLFYDYYHGLIARACLWAAGREPDVVFKDLPQEKTTIPQKDLVKARINFSLPGTPSENCHLHYVIRDKYNNIEFSQTEPCRTETVSLSLPFLKGGEKILDVWLKDGDKRVINWASLPLLVIPPVQIEKAVLNKDIYEKGEPIEGEIILSAATTNESLSLAIEVRDNYRRKVVSLAPALKGKGATFTFQLKNALTSFHTLQASLRDGDKVMDEAEVPFYLDVTHFPSLTSDFSFIMWGGSTYDKNHGVDTALKQFANHGVDILYDLSPSGPSVDWKKHREAALGIARANLKAAPCVIRIDPFNYTKSGPDGLEIIGCPLSVPPDQKTFKGDSVQLKKIARAYGPLGPAFYSLGDENMLGDWTPEKYDLCFCRDCQEQFRNYLKKVYPNLAALNQEWTTDYKDWPEVKPITMKEAVRLKRYPQWIDHRLFMDRLFTDYHVFCVNAVTEIDPGAKVGIEGLCYPGISFSGFNLYQMLPNFHFFSPYGFSKATTSFLPPESFASGIFGAYEKSTGEEIMRGFPWRSIFEGNNSIFWWTSLGGGLGGAAAFSPDYQPLRHFQQAAEEIREIKSGIGKLLLASKREIHPIALYYSNSEMHVADITNSEQGINWRNSPWEASLSDFHSVLRNAGFDYRYLSPDDIASGQLNSFRILILPYAPAISAAEVEKIKAFVQGGGILMADSVPGIMDEHGKMLAKSSLPDVFGTFEKLHINSYGKGRGVYLADFIKGYEQEVRTGDKSGGAKPVCEKMQGLIGELAGVKPFAGIKDATGAIRQDVMVSSFTNGKASFLALIRVHARIGIANMGQEGTGGRGAVNADRPEVVVGLAVPYHIYDVRDHKYLGNKNDFPTALKPGQAKVFALLPAEIRGMDLKVEKRKYRGGEDVQFTATLHPESLKDSGLAIRVEVAGPDGRIIPYYTQTIVSSNAVFNGVTSLSLDESAGNYRITARDIVSGIESVKTFKVK